MLESSESPRHAVLCVPSAGKLREVGNPLEAPAPCLLSRGLPAADRRCYLFSLALLCGKTRAPKPAAVAVNVCGMDRWAWG